MALTPRTLLLAIALGVASGAATAVAQPSMPSTFTTRTITTAAGADIFVRSGGSGPAVVLIHGYGDTGDMWGPLAAALSKTHTVVVPDLRGIGRSSHPATGYDKHTQAADIRAVLTTLGHDHAAVVAHDIGNMVAYAYAARYRGKVDRLVLMDAPIPGIDPWDELIRNPALWHFSFGGPDAERLVQGRERVFLDRFWNEFAADPSKIDEATRAHYAALYAQPGAMRSGFAQFAAFSTDAEANRISQRIPLTMPVLAVGGEKSFGAVMGVIMRNVASDVSEAIVPGAGHWLMEENAPFTVALVRDFIGDRPSDSGERRTSLEELEFGGGIAGGTGTSSVTGIRTVVLKGDPDSPGLYTIVLSVPPNTRIAAHDHPDDRVATVVSGTWYFGYGEVFDAAALEALPVGSFYTEPPNRAHFAETRDGGVILQISGVGPSGTTYLDPRADPRKPSR